MLRPPRGTALFRSTLGAAFLLSLLAPTLARPASLRTGLYDLTSYQAAGRASALRHTLEARASIVRIGVGWDRTARSEPPSASSARDPSWPGYDWRSTDGVVRDLAAAGLAPLLIVGGGAPDWAEGRDRPRFSYRAPAGTWRPSPSAYRYFAEAVARRYSGTFPDPDRPRRALPRVRYLQAWNEPNLWRFLTPQWQRRGGRLVPASPVHYRRLLNAFYQGVKSVSRSNVVVSAGTAPYGDLRRGGRRIAPALFTRQLLCLRGRSRFRPFRCLHAPVRFDALAHHPFTIGRPTRRALNADDVSVADLRKLTRPLRAAIRYGNVRPRRAKQLWVTELFWESSPPDPDGVPLATHARYLEGSFYLLWRQGVDVVTWLGLHDEPKGDGYPFTTQSGIYTRTETVATNGRKPAFTAFRFPFTAYRSRGIARLWGLAPYPGKVAIEARRRGRWRQVASLLARRDRLFFGWLRTRRDTLLRARRGAERSLPWRVR